jgi:ferredoxin
MKRIVEILGGTLGRRGLKSYRVRLVIQAGFALTILLLGIQFGIFVNRALELAPEHAAAVAAGMPLSEMAERFDLPARPPGVEGFLPLSGLIGLLDWGYQGRLNGVHPAASVLLALIILVALLLRKAFCSWICPVGLLSESLARLGRRFPFLRGRNYRLPVWLDIPLRGIKYLLMGFFVWAIVGMSAEALATFIGEDYNIVADVKMLWFFTHMSALTAWVLVGLALGSLFVNGFWCRYLCPYGALLGLFSWASPLRIKRDAVTCTDCGICDQVCMARLPVSKKKRIISPECTGCLDCVASCPTTTALGVADRRQRVGPLRFALLVLVLFLGGYAAARAGGYWENRVHDLIYMQHIPHAEEYGHPR